MKRIHYIIIILLSLNLKAVAQSPTEAKITVTYMSEDGNEVTEEFTKTQMNSFTFVGGNGTVEKKKYDKGSSNQFVSDGEMLEENKDVYAWVEYVDFNTTKVYINQNYIKGQSEIGLCVSTKPNVPVPENIDYDMSLHLTTDNITLDYSNSYRNKTIDISSFDLNEQKVYREFTSSVTEQANPLVLELDLNNLGYVTTYYYRPYVKFYDGQIMYGGEKSFSTPHSVAAVLHFEEDVRGGNYINKGVVMNTECLQPILDKYPEFYAVSNIDSFPGIKDVFDKYLTDDDIARLKSLKYRTIECTDGTIYMVNQCPEDIVERIYNTVNVPFEIEMDPKSIDNTLDSKGNPAYTKNISPVQKVSCDESWGISGNSYLDISPSYSSVNPSVAFSTKGNICLAKSYDIYLTLVNPDPESDPRPNRFYTYIYERYTDGRYIGDFPSSGNRMSNPDNVSGNYFISDGNQRVSRLYLGNYTFKSCNDILIQFQTQVTTKLTLTYNRQMRFAKIEFIPKNDE